MKTTGDIIVFVNSFEYTNEKGITMYGNRYNTTISNKQEDGSYINASMEVKFSNDIVKNECLADYEDGTALDVELTDSWLSCRAYTDKEGNERKVIYLFVNNIGASIEPHEAEQKPKKKPLQKPGKKSPKR